MRERLKTIKLSFLKDALRHLAPPAMLIIVACLQSKTCLLKAIWCTFPGNTHVFLSTRKLDIKKEQSLVPQSFVKV